MQTFLVVQASYQNYEIGLFNKDGCFDRYSQDKKYASKNLIPSIHSLLKNNKISIQNITAIGANQGPGPFTSIRIILSTVNGIAFGTKISLYGINSLEALLLEYHDLQWPYTIAMLNACNNDVYYALQQPDKKISIGCSNIKVLLESIKKEFPSLPLRFLGNGVLLAPDSFKTIFGSQAYIPEPVPQESSLEQIAQLTRDAYYQSQESSEQLLPIYLKNIAYATAQLR